MRVTRSRRPVVAIVTATLLLTTSALVPSAGVAASAAKRVPALAPAVVRAGLAARGEVVRRSPGVRVERLHLAPDVRARLADPGNEVYRVTVAGRFPPRPLRYVVRAGGRRIGFGIPRRDERAVTTITTDERVLTEPLAARYEGRVRPAPDVDPRPGAERAPLPTPDRST